MTRTDATIVRTEIAEDAGLFVEGFVPLHETAEGLAAQREWEVDQMWTFYACGARACGNCGSSSCPECWEERL